MIHPASDHYALSPGMTRGARAEAGGQRPSPAVQQAWGPRSGRRWVGLLSPLLLLMALLTAGCAQGKDTTLSSCRSVGESDTGSCVRSVQNALYLRGLLSGVDGVFGPATTAAVREFQTSHGLTTDGIAGRQTLAELEKSLCDSFLGSCTRTFDRTSTRQIYQALGEQGGAVEQGSSWVFCKALRGPHATVICDLLLPLGVDVVRDAAGNAVQNDACLTVDPARIPVRLYSDSGPGCA